MRQSGDNDREYEPIICIVDAYVVTKHYRWNASFHDTDQQIKGVWFVPNYYWYCF